MDKRKRTSDVLLGFGFTLFLSVSFLSLEKNAEASLSADPFDRLVEKSKLAPVPQRVQIGPTCGLYALGMVMDYWFSKNSNNPTYLVSDIDFQGRGTQYNYSPTSPEEILPYVQGAGYTLKGEMFSAQFLAQTAAHFGYQAAFYPLATLEDLYGILDRNHPAIVAFDVDSSGNPGLFRGMKAHYGVIEGYFDYNGARYVIARHGWGTQKDYVWRATDLIASMKNLKYTNYYPSTSAEPAALRLPAYRAHDNREDITESLGDKIIEVIPPGEQPAGGILVR